MIAASVSLGPKDVELDAFLAENEKSLGETLKAVGLAKQQLQLQPG